MSSIDWGTVSTSLVTSGGVLFAAYKLWFQRRLEDHKRKLDNNSKLFDIEIDLLRDVSALNAQVQSSKLNIRKELPITEAFISRHHEYMGTLSSLYEKYAFVLSCCLRKEFEAVIKKLEKYAKLVAPYESNNRSYGGGRFPAYESLPNEVLDEASNLMKEIDDFFLDLQKRVFDSAGR